MGEEEARDRRRHSVVNLFAGWGAAGGCAPRSWVRAPSCHGGAAAIALSSPACLSPKHCLILGVGGAVFCVRKARGDDRDVKWEERLVFNSCVADRTGTLRLTAGMGLGGGGAPVLVELEGQFAHATRLEPVSRAGRSWWPFIFKVDVVC